MRLQPREPSLMCEGLGGGRLGVTAWVGCQTGHTQVTPGICSLHTDLLASKYVNRYCLGTQPGDEFQVGVLRADPKQHCQHWAPSQTSAPLTLLPPPHGPAVSGTGSCRLALPLAGLGV